MNEYLFKGDSLPLLGTERVISSYLDSLVNVGQSTKDTYLRALRPFFVFLQSNMLDAPTRADIVKYKSLLLSKIDGGELSALTVCSYLNAIRGFFSYCESEGIYPNIAKGVKSPKHTTQHKKQHLESGKVKELLSFYNGDDISSLRNYAMVNLLVRTGLRTGELASANIEDISFVGSSRVLWIKGKGRTEKDSYVQLTEKAYAPIRRYLLARSVYFPKSPLFVSVSNHHAKTSEGTSERLTTRTIRKIVREGLDSVGLDDKAFTAHSLRHTTAVFILECGGGLEDVQAQLRHASINTSRIYVESFNKSRQLTRINEAMDSYL